MDQWYLILVFWWHPLWVSKSGWITHLHDLHAADLLMASLFVYFFKYNWGQGAIHSVIDVRCNHLSHYGRTNYLPFVFCRFYVRRTWTVEQPEASPGSVSIMHHSFLPSSLKWIQLIKSTNISLWSKWGKGGLIQWIQCKTKWSSP